MVDCYKENCKMKYFVYYIFSMNILQATLDQSFYNEVIHLQCVHEKWKFT